MNKKSIVSLLAIIVVAVLSIGIASCEGSNMEKHEVTLTTSLSYQIVEAEGFSDIENVALNALLKNLISHDSSSSTDISVIKESHKQFIQAEAPIIAQKLPEKTFTFVITLKDVDKDEVIGTWTVKCDKGVATVS